MKKRNLLIASILCVSLIFIYSVGALGTLAVANNADPTVTLTASGNQASFAINRDDSSLFDNLSGFMPGDTRTQKLIVESASGNSGKFNIYMYAVNSVSSSFIDNFVLNLNGTNSNILKASEANDANIIAAKRVLLGAFNPGDNKTINVSLTLPIETGNNFQNAEGTVEWHFYAEQVSDGTIINGGGGTYYNPLPSATTIPSPSPPLAATPSPSPKEENTEPEPTNIGSEAVPTGSSPQTGDESHLVLWIIVMVASGSSLTCLLVFGKNDLKKSKITQESVSSSQRK